MCATDTLAAISVSGEPYTDDERVHRPEIVTDRETIGRSRRHSRCCHRHGTYMAERGYGELWRFRRTCSPRGPVEVHHRWEPA